MTIIALESARPGMRLLGPVTNSKGQTILEGGTILTDRLIEKLSNAGTGSLLVDGAPDHTAKEEVLSKLHKRFETSRNNCHMALLEEAVAEHLEELYGQ